MDIVGLGWLGTRTPHAPALVDFYARVLGLRMTHEEPGFWVFTLPDGYDVEVFDPGYGKDHFDTGPVAGFAVRDLAAATAELRAAGVEVIDDGGPSWQHFRGRAAISTNWCRPGLGPDPYGGAVIPSSSRPRSPGWVVGIAVAGVAAVLVVCALPAFGAWVFLFAGPDLDDARATADTYLGRIERGEDAAAYGQICAGVRREVPQAAFTGAVESAPRPRSHVIAGVAGQGEAYETATVTARTTDAAGGRHDVRFDVTYDGGDWQICDQPFI